MKNHIFCKLFEFEKLHNNNLKMKLIAVFLIISLFEIQAHAYSPKKSNELLNSINANVEQETITVTGTVTEAGTGIPIPGANVIEKGTNNGTATDFDGNFSLTVTNENAVLQVSYVSFSTQEIPVAGKDTFSIQLEEDAADLDEIVVIGYGTKKKSNLTAAVEMVDTEILENRPVRTVPEMLEGAVPGLNVNLNSGAPDATANINIRGFTGLNSQQGPL